MALEQYPNVREEARWVWGRVVRLHTRLSMMEVAINSVGVLGAGCTFGETVDA